MKKLVFLAALALLYAAPTQAADMRAMAEQITNPIVIEATEMPKMRVTFNHASHKTVSCMTCHHTKSDKGETRYVSCRSCHDKPGARTRHHMSTFMAFHAKDAAASCYSCHHTLRTEQPEKYAAKFSGCTPCHADAVAANDTKKK